MRTVDPGPGPSAFARDLFDGLPRRYDLLVEVLSFGQNRRWRRRWSIGCVPAPAAVCSTSPPVPPGSPCSSLGVRRRPSLASTSVRRCCARVGRTSAAEAPRRVSSSPPVGPSSCRSRMTHSTRSPSATCSGTSTTPPRRCASSPGSSVPGAWSRAWSSPCRRQLWLVLVALHPGAASGGAGGGGRPGPTSAASSGRHRGPLRPAPGRIARAAWQAAEVVDVGTRLMSLGGGLVMWGRKADG